VESREGGLVLPDAEGRAWLLSAASIIAFGFEHRMDSLGRKPAIEVGFHSGER